MLPWFETILILAAFAPKVRVMSKSFEQERSLVQNKAPSFSTFVSKVQEVCANKFL